MRGTSKQRWVSVYGSYLALLLREARAPGAEELRSLRRAAESAANLAEGEYDLGEDLQEEDEPGEDLRDDPDDEPGDPPREEPVAAPSGPAVYGVDRWDGKYASLPDRTVLILKSRPPEWWCTARLTVHWPTGVMFTEAGVPLPASSSTLSAVPVGGYFMIDSPETSRGNAVWRICRRAY